MAAAVEAPVVAKENVVAEATPTPTPVKVGRVKRLEKPDQKELDAKIEEYNTAEKACFARIDEIKALIESKDVNRQETSAEVQAARDRVNKLHIQLKTVLEEKKRIREELTMADQARDAAKADAKALKEKLPFVKVEDIDAEIKRLEYRMAHTTLALPEEKKILGQVRELTKSRDFVAKYTERLQKQTNDETVRSEIAARLKEKEAVINQLHKEVDAQKAALNAVRDEKAAQVGDKQALRDEKQRNHEKIDEIRKAIRQLKAEFKAKVDEYYDRERQWRAQMQEDRKRQNELWLAEREERDRRRKQWEKENYVEPFTDEIMHCDQLINYLQKSSAPAESGAAANPVAPTSIAPPEGSSILVAKKNRNDELDGWFGGLGGAKKNNKGSKGKGPMVEKKAKVEKLTLSLDAISSFAKVKVTAPTTKDGCLKTIELLKEKKEEYVKLQKEAEVKRKADEEAEEAAAVAAKAAAAAAAAAPAEAPAVAAAAVAVAAPAAAAATPAAEEEAKAKEEEAEEEEEPEAAEPVAPAQEAAEADSKEEPEADKEE